MTHNDVITYESYGMIHLLLGNGGAEATGVEDKAGFGVDLQNAKQMASQMASN